MKIYIEPRVEAGTDRGGENLYLDFSAHHDGDTPPNEPIEVVLSTRDDWEGSTIACTEDGEARIRYKSPHYEFEWEGTGDDALGLILRSYEGRKVIETQILDYFKDPSSWQYCHKPGQSPKLVCELEYLIDGNAE